MPRPGPRNAPIDAEGLQLGHHSVPQHASGVTVTLCPQGATAGVDVRGSVPGTRETYLMDPVNLVERVKAVILSGGSVHGLAAADGVVEWLAARGLGFDLGGG